MHLAMVWANLHSRFRRVRQRSSWKVPCVVAKVSVSSPLANCAGPKIGADEIFFPYVQAKKSLLPGQSPALAGVDQANIHVPHSFYVQRWMGLTRSVPPLLEQRRVLVRVR
jgi:hypothetical protein